jgi:curli production assembly/transport component CsgG
MFRTIAILLLTFILVGCAGKPDFDVRKQTPSIEQLNTIAKPLDGPVVIAVYDFVDMTGQKKPGGNFASMSTAVTQGSYQILIKALQDTGEGKWFRVVERSTLPSLLQERKLIRSTRQQVDKENAQPLPPLLFAGAYITGGVVGYDSDVKSGGVGARILGIQANKQYRQDIVTIILRVVNVQSGEVVASVTVEKTIFSTGTGSDIFKYFDADTMLLETEIGVARNEPVTFALRKAIEKGVIEIILEGVDKGLWQLSQEDVIVVPDIKDYIPHADMSVDDKTIESVHLDIINEKKEKTYEQYQEEKALKKELQEEALEKKKCTNIKIDQEGVESCIDELDWKKVDEEAEKVITPQPKPELEEVKNENDNETVDTSTSTN